MDKHRNVSRIIGIVFQSKGGDWERKSVNPGLY